MGVANQASPSENSPRGIVAVRLFCIGLSSRMKPNLAARCGNIKFRLSEALPSFRTV